MTTECFEKLVSFQIGPFRIVELSPNSPTVRDVEYEAQYRSTKLQLYQQQASQNAMMNTSEAKPSTNKATKSAKTEDFPQKTSSLTHQLNDLSNALNILLVKAIKVEASCTNAATHLVTIRSNLCSTFRNGKW